MKVFVSHSMKDQKILESIDNAMNSHGIELLIAEHKVDLSNTISEKIKNMIESCHLGLILLTLNGLESGFVREEIGYLDAKKKPCLLIFEKGLNKEYGGFKFGHDYVELDANNSTKAVDDVKKILIIHWEKVREQEKQKVLREKREKQNTYIALGILAGLLILGSD